MNAPNIIHSPSDKGQEVFLKEQCDKLVRSENRVQCGKGSRYRKVAKSIFDANFSLIKWS
jgi:hypothetical protein